LRGKVDIAIDSRKPTTRFKIQDSRFNSHRFEEAYYSDDGTGRYDRLPCLQVRVRVRVTGLGLWLGLWLGLGLLSLGEEIVGLKASSEVNSCDTRHTCRDLTRKKGFGVGLRLKGGSRLTSR